MILLHIFPVLVSLFFHVRLKVLFSGGFRVEKGLLHVVDNVLQFRFGDIMIPNDSLSFLSELVLDLFHVLFVLFEQFVDGGCVNLCKVDIRDQQVFDERRSAY